jgi:hypothetical protein
MMRTLTLTGLTVAALAVSPATAATINASQISDGVSTANAQPKVEHVRMVCNAFGRCWWRPGPAFGWGRPWGPRRTWMRHRFWRRWG